MKICLACILCSSIPCYADQFLCVAGGITGFSYEAPSDEWKETSFIDKDSKYLVSKNESEHAVWKVTQVGEQFAFAYCRKDFNKHGFLSCSGHDGEFRMQKENGRFLKTYTLGYYNVLPSVNNITDNSSGTPTLEIGKCSRL